MSTTHDTANPKTPSPASAPEARLASAAELELSVVIPCLDEHETIGICVEKALRAIAAAGIAGEVVVADNGSTDGSIEIAEGLGARVVPVAEKGYGAALMGGIEAARGKYIIMGDADDSYDFLVVEQFVEKLRQGHDLVQGCRLPWGGGKVQPGAMPFLHYWLGNPLFTVQARIMFGAPIHDIYCGMRGFTKAMYDRLGLRCVGMEFATEMIIKASLFGEKICETPITLYPDGRKSRRPHLRTFRDGWRTLRFFLLFSPRWIFWLPGLLLLVLGTVGYALALPGVSIGGARLDVHTLLVASLVLLIGFQSCVFSILATTYAVNEGMRPMTTGIRRFFDLFNLERGIAVGVGAFAVGFVLVAWVFGRWWQLDFGGLDYPWAMRRVIPGVTLMTLGYQTLLNSFLCSILGVQKR